jgi:hypothetical protein
MKLRPQYNLKFRDVDQFLRLKSIASHTHLSLNEFILRSIEAAAGNGYSAPVEQPLKPKRAPHADGCQCFICKRKRAPRQAEPSPTELPA